MSEVELLASLGGQAYGLGFYAVSFIFVLSLIVFVHEYGHFKVARWCGVRVETFSIGFGREIFGWTDRPNTRWKVGWIPLGGYVKFEGDANVASMPSTPELEAEGRRSPTNFHGKPVGQRALIVVAGPMANFLLAIVIFATSFAIIGLPKSSPLVETVQPGSAAELAGLRQGDMILSINGQQIDSFTDIQRIVMQRAGETLPIVVDRAGEEVSFTVTPRASEVDDGFGGKIKIGVIGITSQPGAREFERKGVVESVGLGMSETWHIISSTGVFLKRMVTGYEDASQLGGPIAIAQISGRAATAGFYELINLAAVISVSIGLINLFPIPMLDGGHLVYYAIEAVRGRPLGEKAQEIGFRIGFALVMMLMVFSTWNDIMRIVRF